MCIQMHIFGALMQFPFVSLIVCPGLLGCGLSSKTVSLGSRRFCQVGEWQAVGGRHETTWICPSFFYSMQPLASPGAAHVEYNAGWWCSVCGTVAEVLLLAY
jgi:hypothetical protein